MPAIRKTIVVAKARNGIIGRKGGMPWRLSTDLKRFKAITLGKPIIVGRKTFESFGGVLPGRPHVVVSRRGDIGTPGIHVAASLGEAIAVAEDIASDTGQSDIFIVGGGEIYKQAMDVADRLCVTEVDAELDGDTFFPVIDPAIWQPVETSAIPAGEKDDYPTCFVVYERRSPTLAASTCHYAAKLEK